MYAADEDTAGQRQPLELMESVMRGGVAHRKGNVFAGFDVTWVDVRAVEPQENRQ